MADRWRSGERARFIAEIQHDLDGQDKQHRMASAESFNSYLRYIKARDQATLEAGRFTAGDVTYWTQVGDVTYWTQVGGVNHYWIDEVAPAPPRKDPTKSDPTRKDGTCVGCGGLLLPGIDESGVCVYCAELREEVRRNREAWVALHPPQPHKLTLGQRAAESLAAPRSRIVSSAGSLFFTSLILAPVGFWPYWLCIVSGISFVMLFVASTVIRVKNRDAEVLYHQTIKRKG
jgi:hypothetical protein